MNTHHSRRASRPRAVAVARTMPGKGVLAFGFALSGIIAVSLGLLLRGLS